jgi:hypothetical protein
MRELEAGHDVFWDTGKGKHVAINLMDSGLKDSKRRFFPSLLHRKLLARPQLLSSPITLQPTWSLQLIHVLLQLQMPKNRLSSKSCVLFIIIS